MQVNQRYVTQLERENKKLKDENFEYLRMIDKQMKIMAAQLKEIRKLNEILNRIDEEWAEEEKEPCGAVTHDKGNAKLTNMIISTMGGKNND